MCDRDLVDLLRHNDQEAYAQIYERYHSLLYSFAYRKIQDKQESQDIVQDVLVNIWNKRSELLMRGSLDVYLYTAVRNRAFDFFAHRKVEEKYYTSLDSFLQVASNGDHLARENYLKDLIAREIAALPPRMQEIFRLSRENFLTNKEIADLLELSPHTIDTQVKRALKILKERLGPYYVFLFFFLK